VRNVADLERQSLVGSLVERERVDDLEADLVTRQLDRPLPARTRERLVEGERRLLAGSNARQRRDILNELARLTDIVVSERSLDLELVVNAVGVALDEIAPRELPDRAVPDWI